MEKAPGTSWWRTNLPLVGDFILVMLGIAGWLAMFLLGTLVDSSPYRTSFSSFEGGLVGTLKSGAVVVLTYTLTNVAILCLIACLLGAAAARARLGEDADDETNQDRSAPRSSAVLRGFLVYLSLLAGVLLLGDDPAGATTQKQYVRLAGVISLLGFMINYRPQLFGRLLRRAGALVESGKGEGEPKPEPKPAPRPRGPA